MTLPGLKVAIVDANPLLAEGIAALLARDPDLVAQTAYLGPDMTEATDRPFDVMIVDPSQVAPGRFSTARRNPGCAVIGYSSTVCPILARTCITAGFRGLLPRTVPLETLKIALATVARGGLFIDSAFAAAITTDQVVEDPPVGQEACLSARELFVLKSVAHGKSMKDIGNELSLSSKTIETYKARGSNKLNLSGRRQIVEFAIAQGWVAPAQLTVG